MLRATLIAALILTGTTACSRGAANTRATADTVYVGVAVARPNAAYFNGV